MDRGNLSPKIINFAVIKNSTSQMKVLKFGGTSVGTAKAMTNLVKIVEGLSEPSVVVVSALGGVTDKLIDTANRASVADESYRSNIS